MKATAKQKNRVIKRKLQEALSKVFTYHIYLVLFCKMDR